MPNVPPTETEIRDAVVALLNDWVDPGTHAVDRFIGSVAGGFTGFGTAPGEYFRTRAVLRAMTEREHDAMRHPFTLRVPWMNVRMLHESLALVEGELAVEIQTGNETFVEAPRFSLILERDDRHSDEWWILLHVHMSVPDTMQNEGDTMGVLLTTRNQELEREVIRRTNELREQTDVLRTLTETNAILAAELDLETLVQRLVDAGQPDGARHRGPRARRGHRARGGALAHRRHVLPVPMSRIQPASRGAPSQAAAAGPVEA